MEGVNNFNVLGVQISDDLTFNQHVDTIIKEAQLHLYFLRRLRRFDMSPNTLELLQVYGREHIDWLHHNLVWQLEYPRTKRIIEWWPLPGPSFPHHQRDL